MHVFLFDPTFILVLRIIVGAFLVFSGFMKVLNLNAFWLTVAQFNELARKYGKPFAYALPFIEMIVGVILIIGFYLQFYSFITILMAILFGTMVATALVKKKKIENCGCFGANIKMPISWRSLAEDILFFIAALIIFLSTIL
ncbi:DoxX family membrane protein [Candidatus Woesearchaeota archaeon]|nr:DoxX family membrane protein [Candidatus Woesearchaeota archaeon]